MRWFALLVLCCLSSLAQQSKPIAVSAGILEVLNAGSSEYKAADLQAFAVDLNDDGTPEIALIGRPHSRLCSGSGNCSFWLFQSTPAGYVNLIRHQVRRDGDVLDHIANDWKVLPDIRNGYHVVELFYRDLPWRATATRYQMNNGKYEYLPGSCQTITYGYFIGGKFHEFTPPKSQPCARRR